MIVGIDNITPGTSTSDTRSLGGMRPYLQDLLDELPRHLPAWQFRFFTPVWNEPFEIRHPNVETIVCPSPRFRPARVLYEQLFLPRAAARAGIDLWLGTCNYLPLALRAQTVLIVQSHQYFTHPEAFSPLRRAWLPRIVRRSVHRADLIGVQSADARDTLLRHTSLPPDRVRVIYNRVIPLNAMGPEPDLRPLLGRRRPYLLYVSGFYPFKNHRRLIEAFKQVKHLVPDLALALVGGAVPPDLRTLDEDVVFTGRVPQSAISALYRNAIASVFPSLEETFGLPVLESMSLDCPVVTSNRSSMAEIAGAAALLVDPWSVDSLASGLRRILLEAELRDRLIEAGRIRSAQFSTEATVSAVADALREVAAVAYNTGGGLSFSNGSPGYTGTDVHLCPGSSPVRAEKAA